MQDRISHLFHSVHRTDPEEVLRLEQDQIEALRAVVLGVEESPNRVRALSIYAGVGAPDALQVISSVLLNENEDPGLRAVAASEIGGMDNESAGEVLRESLQRISHPLVQIKVADALATSGNPAAMTLLQPLAASADNAVARQARFAQLLIAHRYGLDEPRVERPDSASLLSPSQEMAPFEIHEALPLDLELVARFVRPQTFAVASSRQTAFSIACGRDHYVLLASQNALDQFSQESTVVQRPSVLALVMKRAEVDGGYSVWRIVLADPSDNGFYIAAYRKDGEMTHFGEAHRDGGAMSFEVRSVDRPGNLAVHIAGSVRASRVSFTSTLAASEARAPSTPARMDALLGHSRGWS